MTRPLRIYRHGDSLIGTSTFSACEIVAGEGNPANHHPGKMLQLGTAFQVYEDTNDQLALRNDVTGITVFWQIPAAGYSAESLEDWINANVTNVLGFAADYSSTTRKWSFSANQTYTIRWTASFPANGLAETMGFSPASDSSATVAPTYIVTGADAVYVKDYHWVGWNVAQSSGSSGQQANGLPLEMIMAYATNLSSSDTIQAFAHLTWLGERPEDWQGAAAFQGVIHPAHNERSNDLYHWEVNAQAIGTGGQVTDVPVKYVAFFIFRGDNPTQLTMKPFKLGVAGVWSDANFDGADYSNRTIRSAFESTRVVLDSVSQPDAGGAWDIGVRRGYRKILMSYGGWDTGAHDALDGYLDRYRVDPALWMPDPDFVTTDSTLFGAPPPGGWSGVDWKGPGRKRAATIEVHGARMQPET